MRVSSNPELAAAWATVPAVAEAQERYEAAVRLRRGFPRGKAPAEALAGVQDDAIAAFTATGKWPADYARKAAKAHADAVVWESEVLALRRLEESTKATVESTRHVLSADALSHLDGRLKEILGAAKSDGESLGDVTTPAEAIEAGGAALDAWRRLTSLLKDYVAVRAAQWEVLRAVALEDEWARVRKWREAGHGEVAGVRIADVSPHIADVMKSGAYTVEYLVWIAQSDAGYVPTSYADLEDEATADDLVDVYAGADGPVVDYSPSELPQREPRPARTFTYSRTPHLDHAQPTPDRPTATADMPDREPTTLDYYR